MSNQPSNSPTWRATDRQKHHRGFNSPGSDTERESRAAPSPPPSVPFLVAEPQVSTSRKRPLPHIFKSKTFSQMDILEAKRFTQPSGYVPKPLRDLEITDLFPESDSRVEASSSPNTQIPEDAATNKGSSERNTAALEELSITFSLLGSNPEPGHPDKDTPHFLNQHPSLSHHESTTNAPTSTTSLPSLLNSNNPSYHTLPHPTIPNQHPIPQIYTHPSSSSSTTSTTTLTPSETSLLRPQSFLSFLAEYSTSFVNWILDVNVNAASRGLYGLSRRNRGDTRNGYNYGQGENMGMGMGMGEQRRSMGGQGQGNQILRYRERQRGVGGCRSS